MKKILILTILGTLLTVTGGCRFLDCLWRGGPTNQATTVPCPSPCSTYTSNDCNPCSAPAVTPNAMTPGPDPTYAPSR
jgi:hypothetical protein